MFTGATPMNPEPWDQRRWFAQRYAARSGPAFEWTSPPAAPVGAILKVLAVAFTLAGIAALAVAVLV